MDLKKKKLEKQINEYLKENIKKPFAFEHFEDSTFYINAPGGWGIILITVDERKMVLPNKLKILNNEIRTINQNGKITEQWTDLPFIKFSTADEIKPHIDNLYKLYKEAKEQLKLEQMNEDF